MGSPACRATARSELAAGCRPLPATGRTASSGAAQPRRRRRAQGHRPDAAAPPEHTRHRPCRAARAP
eukprot:7035044-Prymnesium_polylepis.1